MRTLILSLLLISSNSFAEMCAPVLEAAIHPEIRLTTSRLGARYFSKSDLIVMFSVRDRIKEKGFTTINSKEEAEIFGEISGTDVKIGSQISMRTFESLISKAYYNYIVDYSNKPQFREMDHDDVLQAAQIGFLNAVRTFDYNKGMLSSIAHYHILKEINLLVLDQDIVTRYSHSDHMIESNRLKELTLKLKMSTSKTPTVEELAEAYTKRYSRAQPMTPEKVKNLMSRYQIQQGSMLHPDGTEIEFPSHFGDPESLLNDKQEVKRIQELFRRANLSPKQIRLLVLSFGIPIHVYDNQGQLINVPEGGMTLREISPIDGTTHQALHRQLQNALDKLRTALAH